MELYKVVKQIGRGNYGSVYLVESLETGEPLCLKKISFFGMSDSEKDAAKQEVALLSSLRHPCIVRYVDSFIQDSTLHIVMQMCEGGDLASRIKAAKRAKMYFEEGQILDWLCQLAFAVAYIHKRRVLHRDLKTQNVFLTSNNLVRLGDFGIARVLEHTFENARTVVGTPYYMSPEVCENKDYNAASDMWALGCVLYEMCTLQHAFSANNLLGLVYKIVQEAHPPIPSHYTEDMRNLVNAMLSKNPHERYEAEEILELPFVKARLEKLALQLEGTTAGAKTPAMRPNQKKSNSSTTTSAALGSNMSNDNSSSGENGGDNLSSSAAASSSSPERIEELVASASVLSPPLSMEAGLKPLAGLPLITSAPSEALFDVAGVDVNKKSLQGDSVTSSSSSSSSTSINDSSSAAVSLPVPQFDTNTSVNSATNSSDQPQNTSQTSAALSQPPGIRRTSSIVTPTHHGLPLSPNASPIKQHGINGGSPTSASLIAPSSSTSSSTSSTTITNGSSSTVGISLSPLSGGKAPRSRRPSSLITSPQPVTSSPLAPLSLQPVGYSSSSSSSSSSSLAPLSTPSRRGSGVTPIPGLLLSPPSTHSSNNGLAPLQLAGYANGGGGGSGGTAAGSSSSRSLDTAGSSSTNTTDRGNGGFLSPGWAPSSTPVHSITSPYSKYSQVGSGSSRNSNGSGGGGGGSGLHQNDAFVIDRQQRRPSSSANDLPHTSNGSTSTPSSSRRASAISSIVNAARIETAMADAQEAAQMSNNQRRPSYLFSNAISSSPPPFLSSSSSMYVDSARRNSKTSSGVSMNSPARQGGGTVVHKLSGAISASRELNLNQDTTSLSSSYSSPAAVVTENEAAAQQHSISSQQHVNVINRPASSSSLPQILPPITIGSGGGGGGRTSASSRVSSAASSEHRKQLIYNNNVGIAGDDDPSDRWQGEEEAEREAVVEAEKRRRRMMIEKRRSSKTIHNLHTDDEGNAIMAFGSEGYDDDDNDKDGGIENEVDDAQNIVDVDNGFNNHHELPHYISRPVSTGSGYLSDGFSDDGFEENLDVDAIHKNRVATEEVENIMAILAEDEHSLHTLQAIAQVYLKQGDGGGGGDGSMTGRSSILLPRRSSSRAGVGSSISTNSEPSSSGLKTPSRPPARSSSSARLTDDPTTMMQTPVSSTRESLVNTPMPSSSSSSSSSTMTTTPVVPVMSSSPMQQTQKRSLDVTPKKSTGGGGGGGGGMLSPDTFQKIKHTYLDTPSATPVVVSSHTTMQRAPSYFMAQQSQQQQQLEQPSSLVSASTTTKGASSAIYSRAHVDALRAKCRASLGPAVLQNVEAFLREQRASTGSGGGGGAHVVLSQNKIRRSLLAIVLDKNLLPLCSQVAEMLHMESVVLSNELKSSY